MLGSWFATHAPPGHCDGPRSVGYVDPAMHPAAKSNASLAADPQRCGLGLWVVTMVTTHL